MRVVLGSRLAERGRVAIELLDDLAAARVAVRQLDITNMASVERLAAWLRYRLGRCDVLINNAAVLMDDNRHAIDVDLEVVHRSLETNLLGTWRLTQAVVPPAPMRSGLPAYQVSKDAVNSLTRMLGPELADDGILVNACTPDPLRVEGRDRSGSIALSAWADTPVWLATLPDDGPTGGFYCEHASLDW